MCCNCLQIRLWIQVEVVEGVAGEEDHHDEQEEHGEETAEAEGHHDEHDEDGMQAVCEVLSRNKYGALKERSLTCSIVNQLTSAKALCSVF